MQRHEPAITCPVASSNQDSKKPPMASQNGAAPTRRSTAGHHETALTEEASPAPEDFEFCVLSSGGLALASEDAANMCAADEVFSGGKLLPLRLSSATAGDASALVLLRSDSLDGATTAASSSGGFSSRSSSRSASSSSSSCVSRSTSSKSASSDPSSLGSSLSNKSACSFDGAVKRRSMSRSSVFYAHPSPSPRPPRRSGASAARRSTGSAPPPSWGVIRLGVVGAPEVFPRRASTDSRKVSAAAARGGSQSAMFDQASAGTRDVPPVDRKLRLGLLGAGLVCSCSPDAVAPVGTAEAAAAEARQRRKKAEDKKRAAKQKQSRQSTSRRNRILDWLEELSMPRTKSVV